MSQGYSENLTKSALERTNPYVLKYFFQSLYYILFIVSIALMTILITMLVYCCQNKRIIRRTEKQVSWQNQRRNNRFRKELSLKNALDLKQAQEQYIRYWPRVGDFCSFYFKRLGIPRRLAITIVSQCLDTILSVYEAQNKQTSNHLREETRSQKIKRIRKFDSRKIPSRESNISNNQLKKKSRIKRQNIFKQIMGILFMAAKSETDKKQLLFFLDEASHSKDTHSLIQKRKSHCQSDRASGAIIAKANRLSSNFEPG